MTGPQAAWLPDGRRLHLHHGPIDLILEAWGPPAAVAAAYARAAARFDGLLEELVAELPALRSPDPGPLRGRSPAAWPRAVAPLPPGLHHPDGRRRRRRRRRDPRRDDRRARPRPRLRQRRRRHRPAPDPRHRITAAIAARAGIPDRVTIAHADPVRGIATSGWRGRSFSLGIADAVTVLARTARRGRRRRHHRRQRRRPPRPPRDDPRARPATLQTDTDLGDRPVTTAVGPLTPAEIAAALAAGAASAEAMRARGLIAAAALFLAGECRIVGPLPPMPGRGARGGDGLLLADTMPGRNNVSAKSAFAALEGGPGMAEFNIGFVIFPD